MTCTYEFATPTYDAAIRLRDEVLRKPLGRSIVDDPLETEHDQIHVGAFADAELVGTASLVELPSGVLKMRQVAVSPLQQGRHVGRALVRACEQIARAKHSPRLYCHARATAVAFYKACGWVVEGEVFTEVGIEHFVMSAPVDVLAVG